MKKVKRICAVIGIIVLLGLYIAAFVFAIIDDPNSMNYFLAAIVATVIVPALLWAMQYVYDILNKYYRPKEPQEPADPQADAGEGEET